MCFVLILTLGLLTSGLNPIFAAWPYAIGQKPSPDQINHVPTGQTVTFPQLLDVLQESRVVFVGERHGHPPAHRVQARILRGLHGRWSKKPVIGLELFRVPQQEWLNGWLSTSESLNQYIQRTDPGESVARIARGYGAVFYYARMNGLKLVALNPPREWERWLRNRSLEALSPDRRRKLPRFGPLDPYQKKLVRDVFREHVKTGGDFESFSRIHRLWEEQMARRIVEYLDSQERIIVLAGSFHIRYGFGVPKNVFRRRPVSYRLVLPEPTPGRESDAGVGDPSPSVPLLPCDFVWWIPSPQNPSTTP